MSSEDREIYVDTRYPIPVNVDGMEYVAPEGDEEEVEWDDLEEESELLTVDESGEVPEELAAPVPLAVIEQVVSYAKGGSAVVSGVLVIEEVPYVSDYEVRVVER